jgi:hypothetical protein
VTITVAGVPSPAVERAEREKVYVVKEARLLTVMSRSLIASSVLSTVYPASDAAQKGSKQRQFITQ